MTTFSIANDIAKYFAIIPALFAGTLPWLKAIDIMHLHSPTSAILSAIIFNALIIPLLIPVALKGVKYRSLGADALLRRNLLFWGVGGVIVPFIGIKLIDVGDDRIAFDGVMRYQLKGILTMMKNISKTFLLLAFAYCICCVMYPALLWGIGNLFFPFQASGSVIYGPDEKPIGSELIAQPFTQDQYFQPRPSAASYNAAASASAALAASNYALRSRVATMLGPIVRYKSGPKAGQLVGPDIEQWFQKDTFQGAPSIVSQWATAHSGLAQAWVSADSSHVRYVNKWAASHPSDVAQFAKQNPGIPKPGAVDYAVVFFTSFSKENPGRFPGVVTHAGAPVAEIGPVSEGTDIQSTFFDMWRQDNPDVDLQDSPRRHGDNVCLRA